MSGSAGAPAPVPANRRGASTVFKAVITFGLIAVLWGVVSTGLSFLRDEKSLPPVTPPNANQVSSENGGSQVQAQGSQRILSLQPAQAIQWVEIKRGMCYEANLANNGECVVAFLNDENRQELMCQGRPNRHSGPIFRIGFATDHPTTAVVDLFVCK